MPEETKEHVDLVQLTIDDQVVTVPKGTTVYTATKQLGIDIPIFCYQDRMPPFGACRVCLVEVDKMPKLQTSCTLQATEGMVVRTQANAAVKARDEILEFLLINHPLDCPICDRGGECPLQDQVVKFGPGKSRFFEDKRRFTKALPLGPVLMLDRERCIACARCTRFGDVVAGDHALEFIDRGYKTEVGTADGKAPKSKFIGNTIMICPVGALTSEVYRFRARPWDNDTTKTTCTLCPVGCSMILDSRDGEIMRTRSQENPEVNDIWMCDKGWFGYEFSSSEQRLTTPLIRKDGKLEQASWDEAFAFVATKMREAKPSGKIAALGGNNLTIEENYLLQKLMRNVLGVNNVDYRVGMPLIPLEDEGLPAGMEMSIGECEELSHIILMGVDITEEFPVIWLRMKQAINKGAKVIFLGHYAPEIARYMHKTIVHTPGSELETLQQQKNDLMSFLQSGTKSAIFVGSQYLATADRKDILAELLTWRSDAPHCTLNILEGRENSMGARFAGMHPQLKPFGKRVEQPGLNAEEVIAEAANHGWDLLYAVGCDVATKVPRETWKNVRKNLSCLIVQDLFMTETCAHADVVLPSLSFVEKGGSFLNIESRVQKLKPGKSIPQGPHSDSYIFVKIAYRLNQTLVIDEPFLDALQPGRLPQSRPQKIDTSAAHVKAPSSSKDALFASFSAALFDNGVRMKHNEHLLQLAKEPHLGIHPSVATQRGLSAGDRVCVTADGRQFHAHVRLDDGIAQNAVVIPLGFSTLTPYELGINLLNGMTLYIEKIKS